MLKRKYLERSAKAEYEEKEKYKEQVKKLQEENRILRNDKDDEHLENYNQYQKLLAIEKILREQDYGSIDNLKNKIRTILNKESVDNLASDN